LAQQTNVPVYNFSGTKFVQLPNTPNTACKRKNRRDELLLRVDTRLPE
ncbi:32434_t:CDS:2, partial [Racocetra persica]